MFKKICGSHHTALEDYLISQEKKKTLYTAKEKYCLSTLSTRYVCRSGTLAGSRQELPTQNLALPILNYPIAWLESKHRLRSQCVHVCVTVHGITVSSVLGTVVCVSGCV